MRNRLEKRPHYFNDNICRMCAERMLLMDKLDHNEPYAPPRAECGWLDRSKGSCDDFVPGVSNLEIKLR